MNAEYDLQGHNTFGLPARARWSAVVCVPEEVESLSEKARLLDLPLRVLGGGSNIILRPYLDAVVGLMRIKGRSILGAVGEHTLVEAGAGEDWHQFVLWTLDQQLPGLENLVGIPGTVGAAPIQNIGAYGCELADRFHSLVAFDREEQRKKIFDKEECGFGYRQSIFKKSAGRFVVLSVTFALPRRWSPHLDYSGLSGLPRSADPHDVARMVMGLRTGKLPDWRIIGNVGSFFHNPVVQRSFASALKKQHSDLPLYPQPDGRCKLSAAWLIERCGLKGLRTGEVGVSEQHALVLVNHGDGTQEQVAALAARIKFEVRSRFGVLLVEEPETL